MTFWGRFGVVGFAIAAVLCLCAPVALANSAEPPRVVVYVSGVAPDDLLLYAVYADGSAVPFTYRDVAWERYYALYPMRSGFPERIVASREGMDRTWEFVLSQEGSKTYNDIYTIHLGRGTIAQGKSPLRTGLLIALRVSLTLIIEGLAFWLFGYREKRSWLLFLLVNLLTQGILNVVLGVSIYPVGYAIFGLVFGEFFVFLAEALAFPLLLRERKKGRAVLYTLTANTASLVLGGFLITLLPV